MIKVINLSTLNRQAKFIIIIIALKEHSRFFLFCLLHILTENSLQKQSMKQKQCDQHSQCFFNPLLLFHKSNTEIAILKRIFYKQILHWHLYFFFFLLIFLFFSLRSLDRKLRWWADLLILASSSYLSVATSAPATATWENTLWLVGLELKKKQKTAVVCRCLMYSCLRLLFVLDNERFVEFIEALPRRDVCLHVKIHCILFLVSSTFWSIFFPFLCYHKVKIAKMIQNNQKNM